MLIVDWKKYPIRTCRTSHACALCIRSIRNGQAYHDGGYDRRAHVSCVVALGPIPEIDKSQWTPVSTPPAEGRPVLAWGRRGFDVGTYRGTSCGDQLWDVSADDITIDDPEYNPTHWMELPGRPEKEEPC